MINGLGFKGTSRYQAALSGMVSAALALALGELVASVTNKTTSLVLAVGEFIVEVTPGDVVRTSIETLGNSQKVVLLSSITVISILFGAFLGLLSRKQPDLSYSLFILFGIFGGWTLNRDPLTSTAAALSLSAIATLIGVSTFFSLNSLLDHPASADFEDPKYRYADRRQFLNWATGISVAAGTMTGVGRLLLKDDTVQNIREKIVIPNIEEKNELQTSNDVTSDLSSTATTIPSTETDFLTFSEMNAIEGISPYITSNDDFYRIDTALRVPTIEPADWSLTVDGLVENPYELSYEEILEMELVKKDVTLTCVSNEIGGPLVGNAVWAGVPLSEIISKSEPLSNAEQVMCHSVDGFTAGFPIENIFDGRTALLAVGMNGRPLPVIHGFPARLVVAGLYGYVSAVKWIKRIEICTWDGNNGYWIPRGWSKKAPIKISSRIDVPRERKINSGVNAVAGVAWAPLSGVRTVEISFDSGPWQECNLGVSLSGETWTQWAYKWDAIPGKYKIKVRAIDNNGVIQSSSVVSPAPDGAEGFDQISVRVV
ncbi:MAG: molybdopterin-dependent oxidoreductase [Acidimicrobiales bacterium]|tara:strand:+ start:8631 stop:10256 length:1626 start_codon:yes stop_codon:yes gene_type:complete